MNLRWVVGLVAAALIAVSAYQIERGYEGLRQSEMRVGATPVTVLRPAEQAEPAPAVVIAHGFAGSRQLMEAFAVTLARNGFIAVSFDFLGHGRHPDPLTGDVTKETGATAALVAQLQEVVSFARDLGGADGRVALLGHSMASDIIVRAAVADPTIEATVAVSMFSSAVSAEAPRNLLIVVGGWEDFLSQEALKAVALSAGPEVREAVTYGAFEDGSARRAAFADNAEHVAVLYSEESMAESLAWLERAFGRTGDGYLHVRGPWIVLMLIGVVAIAWPLSTLLPRIKSSGAATLPMTFDRSALVVVGPAIATPLLLWPVPTGYLPILVADYLALHFMVYGGLTMLLLRGTGRLALGAPSLALVGACAAVAVFGIAGMGAPLDLFVASFVPTADRLLVMALLAVGAVIYTLADAWATRAAGFPMRAGTKIAFLVSLGIAVALNFEDLFFLVIIFPVIVLFFLLYGLFGRWATQATGHPSASGFANGLAFAWALGVTFPLVAG